MSRLHTEIRAPQGRVALDPSIWGSGYRPDVGAGLPRPLYRYLPLRLFTPKRSRCRIYAAKNRGRIARRALADKRAAVRAKGMHPFSQFKDPPATYRAMPFWFWNGKLEIPRLERQIADMREKGIGGFFIHARFGLDTEYLSPEWFDCVRAGIGAASRLGMEVWLYDENTFPSGLSDLKVTANTEFRSKFVDLTETRVAGPASVALTIPPGEVLCARAVRYERQRPTGDSRDLTGMIEGNRLNWDAPAGDWQIMIFVLQVLDSPSGKVFGVDYLNRAAAEYFIQTTHEVYAREIGGHFGKTVKGFFVDEPTLLPWHHDICWYGNRPHARVVVWSCDLAEELARQGLPASELLPHLFYTLDETSGRKRLAFYRAASRLYVESFFEPYRRWSAAADGLLLTGHLLLEEGLYCNTIFQADPVPSLACLHIPGTDHLGAGAEGPYGGWAHLPGTRTNIQGEKLVTSVGHLLTGSRVLSETFGCAGWGLSLEDMKRITDWQYSLGVNFMCPHAVFYSIEGFRKTDAPPSHNHNATWPYYRCYGDYVGRLSYMLSGGTHIAQVGVLYPLEGFQTEYEIGRQGEGDRAISNAFDALCTVLPQIHYDYDILHDRMLADARAENGRLRVGGEAFEVIIAPPTPAISPEASKKLHEFRRSGGRVIAFDRSALGEPASIVISADFDDLEKLGERLRGELEKLVRPDAAIEAGEGALSSIRCLHRRNGGRDIYFLINTADAERNAVISLDGEMGLDLYDLEAGDTSPVPTTSENGRTSLQWSFAPYGSAMFVSADPGRRVAQPSAGESLVIELGDEWEFHTEQPNCLILDRWEFEMRSRGGADLFGYRTSVELDDVLADLLLLLDDIEYRHAFMGGMDLAIRVNDREWRNPNFGEYMDPGFKTLDISSAVRRGPNEISLSIGHNCWSGEPKLLTSMPKLLGDFEVAAPYRIRRRSERLRIGSWTDQGYPCYSGTASYTASFGLPDDLDGGAVNLAVEDVGDMFEAVVNGLPAGVRPWRPWKLDISKLVHPGENQLTLKVTNSMQNFMEGVPRASGLLGRARIEIVI